MCLCKTPQCLQTHAKLCPHNYSPAYPLPYRFSERDTLARMHHKVVGNFGSEADVRSLYYSRFRFNETSDVGAYTHGRPAK